MPSGIVQPNQRNSSFNKRSGRAWLEQNLCTNHPRREGL